MTENISWSRAFSFTKVLVILDVFAYQAKTPTVSTVETHRNEGEGSYLKLV